MSKQTKNALIRILIAIHFVVMYAVFLYFWFKFYRQPAKDGAYFMHNRTIMVSYFLLLFLMSDTYQCYKFGIYKKDELVISQTIANLISWGGVYLFACVMAQKYLTLIWVVVPFVIQLMFTYCWFVLENKVYFKIHKPKDAVILYRNESELAKLQEVRDQKNKWVIKRQIKISSEEEAENALKELNEFGTIFVVGVEATLRNGIVKYAVENNKDCYFLPHTGDIIVSGAKHIRSFSVPINRIERSNPSPEYLMLKRLFDIVMSLFGIIILSPFMLITAIIIKAYDKGPIIYKQTRLTKDGKLFDIYKFRSMRVDAEKDGVARLSSGTNDNRITPVGKIIRMIRFDELPQLFNILKGDMTIVGPRPERPEIAKEYEKVLPSFSLRLQAKAGLTGYAQVYGKYNTEPSDKLKMDLMYINNMSLIEDLKIMFATVRILFEKESTEGIDNNKTNAL